MAVLKALGGDESLMKWAEELESKVVVTDGDFTDPSHDPATQKSEFLMTETDVATMIELPFFRNMIMQQLTSSAPAGTDVSDEQVDALIAEAKAALEGAKLDYPIVILSNGDDLVSLTADMNFTITEPADAVAEGTEPATVHLIMAVRYNRLTTDGIAAHTFHMSAVDGNTDMFSVDGVLNANEDGNWALNGNLVIPDENTAVFVNSSYEKADNASTFMFCFGPDAADGSKGQAMLHLLSVEGENTMDRTLGLYFNESSAIAVDAMPLISLQLSSIAQNADTRFDSLNSATPADSTQLLAMTSEELDAFVQEIQMSALGALGNLLSMLPESVSQLLQ